MTCDKEPAPSTRARCYQQRCVALQLRLQYEYVNETKTRLSGLANAAHSFAWAIYSDVGVYHVAVCVAWRVQDTR